MYLPPNPNMYQRRSGIAFIFLGDNKDNPIWKKKGRETCIFYLFVRKGENLTYIR